MRGGRAGAGQARQTLAGLLQTHPGNLWLALGLGEAESRAGQAAQANSRFEQLLREHPNSRPVALTYAEILNEQGSREAGQRAQAMLRPCCRKVVTIRSSSSVSPAPVSWLATACAPARPMPRPPSSAGGQNRR